MAPEEPDPEVHVRSRLRRRLGEEYGMEEADMLLDRPPGGWDALVTVGALGVFMGVFSGVVAFIVKL